MIIYGGTPITPTWSRSPIAHYRKVVLCPALCQWASKLGMNPIVGTFLITIWWEKCKRNPFLLGNVCLTREGVGGKALVCFLQRTNRHFDKSETRREWTREREGPSLLNPTENKSSLGQVQSTSPLWHQIVTHLKKPENRDRSPNEAQQGTNRGQPGQSASKPQPPLPKQL